ncbi:MAG TPA: zf-TFIIB domain-containing protein [Hanamia sp.]|nr:zf-TFIIB domain-containing protein [Hanamia sp.]
MKCPKCDGELKDEKQGNMVVQRCDACFGIWLTYPELQEVEDTVWSDEKLKGTLEFNENPSTLKCPECSSQMVKFEYRYSDVQLDTCPNMHGFWLDKGEEERIKEIMGEDKNDYERKIKAENEWGNLLNHMRSPTFMDKIKSLFNS